MYLKQIHHIHNGAWLILSNILYDTMDWNRVGSTASLFQQIPNKCLNSIALNLKIRENICLRERRRKSLGF